jgi:hypothetical protein
LNQFQQDANASLRSSFQLDGTPPNGRDGSAHKVDIHLGRILLEFEQNLFNVSFRHELDDNLQLFELDIDGIIVFAVVVVVAISVCSAEQSRAEQ